MAHIAPPPPPPPQQLTPKRICILCAMADWFQYIQFTKSLSSQQLVNHISCRCTEGCNWNFACAKRQIPWCVGCRYTGPFAKCPWAQYFSQFVAQQNSIWDVDERVTDCSRHKQMLNNYSHMPWQPRNSTPTSLVWCRQNKAGRRHCPLPACLVHLFQNN